MIPLQNVRTVILGSVTGGTTVQASVDTLGFRAARIIAYSDSILAPTTNSILEESDDGVNFTVVPNTTPGVDWTPAGNTTDQPKVAWFVDLRGRARYLRARCEYGGKASDTFLVADLCDPSDGVNSGADANIPNAVGL
jgi:hypothetical protein